MGDAMGQFILLMGEYWKCAEEMQALGGFAKMPHDRIEALCTAMARVRNHEWFAQMDAATREQFDENQIALAQLTKSDERVH
jgi:hypothetical protein